MIINFFYQLWCMKHQHHRTIRLRTRPITEATDGSPLLWSTGCLAMILLHTRIMSLNQCPRLFVLNTYGKKKGTKGSPAMSMSNVVFLLSCSKFLGWITNEAIMKGHVFPLLTNLLRYNFANESEEKVDMGQNWLYKLYRESASCVVSIWSDDIMVRPRVYCGQGDGLDFLFRPISAWPLPIYPAVNR